MDPQPKPPSSDMKARPRLGEASSPTGGMQAVARRYPRPPGLLVRLVMLCLRPESWAEAARYPTRVTLLPLILIVILGSLLVATAGTSRLERELRNFAAGYDKQYPPMEMNSDGVLSVKGDLADPIRLELPSALVLIDPTGKTTPNSIKSELTILVTSKEIIVGSDQGQPARVTIAGFLGMQGLLPKAGQTKLINGATLAQFLENHGADFAVGSMLQSGLLALLEGLWAALMIFLLRPVVILAAAGPRINPDAPDRRLLLPNRAAVRMLMGLLIPLIVISAILRATDHPVSGLLGDEGAMLFWFFCAGALALWTGFIARKMYGRRE